MMLGRRIKRTRKGQFQLRLSPDERDLLRRLPGELREVIGTDDPSLRRLFPPAYKDDPELEAEYRHFMADDLVASHQRALDVMSATVDADTINEEELVCWLRALNDLRLVLGTRVDVSEEMDLTDVDPQDPSAAAFAVYAYLSHLQEDVVASLGEGTS